MQKSKLGIVWDDRYLLHDTGPHHPERPQRLTAIKEVLDSHNQLVSLKPREATIEEVSWIHAPEHVQKVASLRNRSGYFDLDTPYSPHSSEAAFLAAGGTIEAADQVFEGKLQSAFAFPRPPGHHAEKDRAMGFCLFNNVAIAAEYLIRQKGLERVAIVDVDVHHGNGTQHSFYDRSDVFYLSSHRFPFYPGTGAASEIGRGKGKGFTLNLPLHAMSNDDDFIKGYEEILIPYLRDYKPQFLIISAGFDAHKLDPLGGMRLSKNGFLRIAQMLQKVADESCGGKMLSVLEGGYDLKGIQEGVEAFLEAMG